MLEQNTAVNGLPETNPPPGSMASVVGPSVLNWLRPATPAAGMKRDVVVDMGWGRLIFGQTFADNDTLVRTLCQEPCGKRDVVFYLRDPHVLLSLAPDQLFLDPSHSYRLWLTHPHGYRSGSGLAHGLAIRRAATLKDAAAISKSLA